MSDESPAAQAGLVKVSVRERRGAIVEAVRRLSEAGVGVDDLALRRPTLDDVFLALTGHAAEEAREEQEHESEHEQERERVA
jgi:ABC-2 type transport system ATP-binding protein